MAQLWYSLGIKIYSSIICPIGIISSILTMCTLWKKLRTEKSLFFILMFIVAVCDLLFGIAFLIFIWSDHDTWSYAISYGTVFTLSLGSDLCCLILTAERSFALCWPHKNLSTRLASNLRIFVAVLAIFISITRTRCFFDTSVVQNSMPAKFMMHWPAITVYWRMFSDAILPFILIILMAIFSGLTLIIVIKRRRSKNKIGGTQARASGTVSAIADQVPNQGEAIFTRQPPPDILAGQANQQKQEKMDKINATISLILILDAFFMINQLGYCLVTIINVSLANYGEEKYNFPFVMGSYFAADLAEISAHSFNFICYIQFSKLIRQEFLAFVARVKIRLGSVTA